MEGGKEGENEEGGMRERERGRGERGRKRRRGKKRVDLELVRMSGLYIAREIVSWLCGVLNISSFLGSPVRKLQLFV